MKSTLTGIKDLDLKIARVLSDRDLFNYCKIDMYARNAVCKDENLWRSRFIDKFGESYVKFKSTEKSWRTFYLEIISIIDLDDLTEISRLDKEKYLEFYIKIFTDALGIWDVFDFLSDYLGDTYAPFFLDIVGRKTVIRQLNNETRIFADLLSLSIATFPILRRVLDKSSPEIINIIKNDIIKDPKMNKTLHTENIVISMINQTSRKAKR